MLAIGQRSAGQLPYKSSINVQTFNKPRSINCVLSPDLRKILNPSRFPFCKNSDMWILNYVLFPIVLCFLVAFPSKQLNF